MPRDACVHHALPASLHATRAVVVCLVIIVCAYLVGALLDHGDVIVVAVATATVGVAAERLTHLILRRWVRVV
ncbi:hypothetical protein ITP53_03930 [Nonomuraea sp. K274]|uniref:Uncharacterized protein n=1 Tax=Nonomuraea cypriaca TaxID=1187855 RepID=A0A931A2A0_9ACTN|nr:hypothetical protein [Nonomuraea cypriaca]MBF8184901.1 hypothetical protein [Nonomuraea cypriaca]